MPPTGQWPVGDWHWEPHPDNLLDTLPLEARTELDLLAREITVRDSMVYPDGQTTKVRDLAFERRPGADSWSPTSPVFGVCAW